MKSAAYGNTGYSYSVFVAGIKYGSLFKAQMETGISQTSLSIALKKKSGGPCKVKRNIVVLESWVYSWLGRQAG
jgi:hypothetical protein